MIKLKNVTIKNRLIIILLIWISIFVGFGVFAVRQIEELGSVTNLIYNYPLQVSNAAAEIRVDLIKIQKCTRDLILARDYEEQQKEIKEMQRLDKEILQRLEIIRQQAGEPKTIALEKEIREGYLNWKTKRDNVTELIYSGDIKGATDITKNRLPSIVEALESNLIQLDGSSREKAYNLVIDAQSLEKRQVGVLMTVVVLISLVSVGIFFITIRSVLGPIESLQQAMNKSVDTGRLTYVTLEGKNEIAEMSRYYDRLIKKLKSIFWVKDHVSSLSQTLSGYHTVDELTSDAINTLCKTVAGGRGTFYVYDKDQRRLNLMASYACSPDDILPLQLALGEGIVGQVGLEQEPLLLNNIKDAKICTSIVSRAPINAYVFPVVYEEELLGVIEIASFEPFNDLRLEYLQEIKEVIALNLYAAKQNAKILELLSISEKSREEVHKKAAELENANIVLHSQQAILQQQAKELQDTNAELEEQQQLLQQQSEEMQQTNAQLEEQHQLLQQQTILLNDQNIVLEETKAELELSNKYKSEFLANMSHELRTPLNSIILLSKLILNNKDDSLNSKLQEKIRVIYKSGEELLRLINDILDLSKIEAGRINIDSDFFDSTLFLEELKGMFKSLAKEKGLEFKVIDTIKDRLYGDEHKVSQILRNFISNAIKFTGTGAVTVKIRQDENSLNGVCFTVKDTGVGISQEKQQIIFEEFQQGDNSISRKYGGTGLGLSISKKLAEAMGGRIYLSSNLGEGSEFTLYIPNMFSAEDNEFIPSNSIDYEWENKSEAAAAIDKVPSLESDNQLSESILVIEDDNAFGEYIQDVIQTMGFKAVLAQNGREGIDLAQVLRPRGILLDLGLPDIHGMDVLRELKSIRELRHIPIHILSVGDKTNRPQKVGAIGYHQKPLEEDEIVSLITDMVTFSKKEFKTMLLIEDNKVHQDYIINLMQDMHVTIDVVLEEKDAKQKMKQIKYDIIILDLELEHGDALNICKFMSDKKIDTPVIIYTEGKLTLEQEKEVRKFSDRIIVKTAHSDERLLDEVTLFLHEVRQDTKTKQNKPILEKEAHTLSLKEKSILIVDDDPRNIYSLASALETYDATIIEASSGKEALKKLGEVKIDMVLMDIMMPEMDGYETIKQIRQNNKLKNIPIIAVTAKSLKEDRDKCIEVGANDYISKPIDFDNLIRVIRAWILKG